MCSGRVDLEFVLRAFSKGMDGVLTVGCRLNECNYITHGNYDAMGMVHICKRLLKYIGVDPQRLKIEFMSASEGILFAEVMNNFSKEIRELGPLGRGEGIDEKVLKFKLEAVRKLIPYIKLVEREKMRVPVKSEGEYQKFFSGSEMDRLFDELILDKLAISQIMLLLREKPLPSGEIAEVLGLNPAEISKYLNDSSRQGLVRYDESLKCYALT